MLFTLHYNYDEQESHTQPHIRVRARAYTHTYIVCYNFWRNIYAHSSIYRLNIHGNIIRFMMQCKSYRGLQYFCSD